MTEEKRFVFHVTKNETEVKIITWAGAVISFLLASKPRLFLDIVPCTTQRLDSALCLSTPVLAWFLYFWLKLLVLSCQGQTAGCFRLWKRSPCQIMVINSWLRHLRDSICVNDKKSNALRYHCVYCGTLHGIEWSIVAPHADWWFLSSDYSQADFMQSDPGTTCSWSASISAAGCRCFCCLIKPAALQPIFFFFFHWCEAGLVFSLNGRVAKCECMSKILLQSDFVLMSALSLQPLYHW